jgi:hypothetical protein
LRITLVVFGMIAAGTFAPGALAQTAAPATDKAAEIRTLREELAGLTTQVKGVQERILQILQRLDELEGKPPSEEGALRAAAEAAAAGEAPPAGSEEEALRKAAESAAGGVAPPKEKPEETTFKSRAIGQQALNPEISIVGDFVGQYRFDEGAEHHTDFDFRGAELALESYLDPYSRMKSIIHFHSDHVDLEETYFERFGMWPNVNVTLGKFRQPFGVVNRWHEHALDQVNYPLALTSIFGDEGLSGAGAALDWLMPPCGKASQSLTLQVTNGDNERVFTENSRNVPATLVHYKNYRDLNKDTYLEFGLSGLFGANDYWPMVGCDDDVFLRRDTRWTNVLGADMSFLWEPAERARYRNLEGRAEFYFLNKGILAPDGSGPDTLHAWGMYAELQRRISLTTQAGFRFDYFQPDRKPYADLDDHTAALRHEASDDAAPDLSLAPLAVTGASPSRYLIAPYLTWAQSEFVQFRLEFDHEWGHNTGPEDNRLMFQAVFAAGPHKHDRY